MTNQLLAGFKREKKFKSLSNNAFQIALIFFFLLVVVLPLVRIFFYLDKKAIAEVFNSYQFPDALKNTLTTTIVATIISVVIAYILAYIFTRVNIKCKGVFRAFFILPMLVPAISQGYGLIILFGNNGVITNLLNLNTSIYGFWGIVIGSVLYSFPVAFLMFEDILKYEDYSPYEAASVLGISKLRQFSSITFPFIRKPLISVVFATFTLIITDYGVPLTIGGQMRTLSVLLYEEAACQQNFSSGAVIGVLLLIPAVVAFLFDFFNKDKAKSSFITNAFSLSDSLFKKILSYFVCLIVSLFTLSIIFSFCVQAFSVSYPSNMNITLMHFNNAIKKQALKYLSNSLFMSILTATIGVVISFITSYFSARVKGKSSKVLHLLSITSLAIPGLVLGLSYVIVFNGSFLYGTLAILIMVNSVHFFASPYLMSYNALGKMNENLENVGLVLGASKFKIIKDVIIPQCKGTIAEMFSYFFVNSMMTISAVSFLSKASNRPLSLMINQFEAQNMIECAAVVAIMILVTNILLKTIVYAIKNKKILSNLKRGEK